MCMSSPKLPSSPPTPPPALPPPPPPIADEVKTVAQMKPKKQKRGAQAQLKRQGPTLGGTSGGTGVYMS